MKLRDFPIIRLAPWEHQPDAAPHQIEARAQNVVSFGWNGRHFEVAARPVDLDESTYVVFASFVGHNDEANWTVGTGTYWGEIHRTLRPASLRLTKRLKKRFHYFPFGRLFRLEPHELGLEEGAWAWIAPNGSGMWLGVGRKEALFQVPFRLPVEDNEALLDIPALEIKSRLLREVCQPDSDAAFALRWQNFDDVERENAILCVQQGTVEELRRLLTFALTVEPLVQSDALSWSWTVEECQSIDEFMVLCSPDAYDVEWRNASVRLRFWKRLIWNYFAPYYSTHLLKRHRCVRQYSYRQGITHLSVNIYTPSQHERLEAALFLREWARDKVAPRKLQLLLGHM